MSANRFLLVAPLTIAVALGPGIDVLQGVGGNPRDGGVAQWSRGLLLLLLLCQVASRRIRNPAVLLGSPLVALAIYGAAREMAAGDGGRAVAFALRVMLLWATFVSAFQLSKRGWIGRGWLVACAWAAVGISVVSQIAGRAAGVASVYEGEYVFAGLTGDPAVMAGGVLACVPLFLARERPKASDLLGLGIACVSLAASQRRSAILASVIIGVTFILAGVKSRRKGMTGRSVVFGMVFGGAIIWAMVLSPLGSDLAARFQDANVAAGGTASGRVEFQGIVLARILDRDVMLGVFGEGFAATTQLVQRRFGLAIGSHNDWLDICHALGALGAAIWLLWHFRWVRWAVAARDEWAPLMLAGLAGMLAMELTAGGVLTPQFVPAYALLGVAAGLVATSNDAATRRPTTPNGAQGSGGTGG